MHPRVAKLGGSDQTDDHQALVLAAVTLLWWWATQGVLGQLLVLGLYLQGVVKILLIVGVPQAHTRLPVDEAFGLRGLTVYLPQQGNVSGHSLVVWGMAIPAVLHAEVRPAPCVWGMGHHWNTA